MRSYYPVLNALGMIVLISGLLMAFPIGVSYFLGDGAHPAFDAAALVTVATGSLLWLVTRGSRRDLRVPDGFFLVVSTWIILPVFGALPLMSYLPEMAFTHATSRRYPASRRPGRP